MKKYFRFSANIEKDKDVIEYLQSIPRILRPELIVGAVRFVLQNMDLYIAKKTEKIDKRYFPYLTKKNDKYYEGHCGYCTEVKYTPIRNLLQGGKP